MEAPPTSIANIAQSNIVDESTPISQSTIPRQDVVQSTIPHQDEQKYIDLLTELMGASIRQSRTGVPVRSVFVRSLRFSLTRGEQLIMPLLTTKKVPFDAVATELLWFLRGETTTDYLVKHGVKIWDGNTTRKFLDSRGLTQYRPGECGPIYGAQWRGWNQTYVPEELRTPANGQLSTGYRAGIDQIAGVIKTLRTNPFDRRMVVSAWNPEQNAAMALPPCHYTFQFLVDNDQYAKLRLSCSVIMRSADVALGVPFNIVSYALLTHMIANIVGMIPGEVIITMNDCHIYENHLDGIKEQITRPIYDSPVLTFTREHKTLGDFDQSSFKITDYTHGKFIKYPMN
jgi:thymidylate synthase